MTSQTRTLLCAMVLCSFISLPCDVFAQDSKAGMNLEEASQQSKSALNTLPPLWEYGKLPLVFEPNQGQADSSVRFLSRSAGQILFLEQNQAVLMLSDGKAKRESRKKHISTAEVKIRFAGADERAEILPMDVQLGKSNYFIGNNSLKWDVNIPNYSRVLYRSLYPGVNLVFYGNQGHLEYDFIVAPRADYHKIVLDLNAQNKVHIAKDGRISVGTAKGPIYFSAPKIYQVHHGEQVEIAGGFRLTRNHQISFAIGSYDHDLPLIIDPVLTYSTYLAGSSGDFGAAIVVDSFGNAYVAGLTFSADFPTAHGFQSVCKGCSNAFVTKINPSGTGIVYSTYLGGSGGDQATSIALDSMGNAIIGGSTSSTDFPTKNPIQTLSGLATQGFLSSLSADGSSLNFSTYLGGSGGASVATVTTDAKGNVYAAGLTDSTDFPITPAGNVIGVPPAYPLNDIFVAKLTSSGALTFATAIGPSPQQQQFNTIFYSANGLGIAVDSEQNIYLAGAASAGFPVTTGAYQTQYTGPQPFCGTCTMGFVSKLKPDGSAFVYATYLGGSGGDQVTGLAIDSTGDAYVTGNTSSTDFPTTPGALQPIFPSGQGSLSCCQTFVTKMDATGSSLIFSTFLGGSLGRTQAMGIAIDANGEPFTTGFTTSSNFPLMHPILATLPSGPFGTNPATYITQLNSTGTSLLFSTLFSGSTSTQASAIALDPNSAGNAVYITGTTYDTDFPTTPGAFQTAVTVPPQGVSSDHAFATKFDLATAAPALCANQNSLFLFGSVNMDSFPVSVNLTNCGNALLTITHIDVSGIFKETDNCQSAIGPGQLCTVNVTFHPVVRGIVSGTLTISSNAPVQPLRILIQGRGVAPVVQLSSTILQLYDELVGKHGLATPLIAFNQGDDLLNFSSITLTGKDFVVDSSGCTTAPVQPQSSCTILVTFHPRGPGLRTGMLTLYDNALDSPQSVTIQGNGLTAYPPPVVSQINPSALLQGSTGQTINIFGSGFFPASRIRIHGIQITTTYNGETALSATVPEEFLEHLGELKVDVFTPFPGGGLSNPTDLLIYQDIPLAANDLIFEPYTQRIYASLSSNAASNPNTIVSIDPKRETVGNYLPIGNGPNRLAVSDDGKYLYVGLDAQHSVQQVDLETGTLGSLVALPIGAVGGAPTTAFEIHTVPGRQEDYVVSLREFGSPDGIALVSSGKISSTLLNAFTPGVAVDSLCFLSDPNTFYGANGFQLLQIGIQNQSTLAVISSLPSPVGFGSQFTCDGKYIYDYSGLVFDPVANQAIGTYPLPPASFGNSVFPDSSFGRTYFLTYGLTNFLVFDQKSFAQIGSITLPSNSFEPFRLQRWGRDGFAFLNGSFFGQGNDVILVRSSMAELSAGPNPLPSISSATPQVRENNGNFQLTVEGNGFVPGAVVRWNGSDRTTMFQSSGTLIADIPASDVNDTGVARISVFNPPSGGGGSNVIEYRIREEALVSIAVTPSSPSIVKGTTEQLTATGTYTDGSTRDLTDSVKWSSGTQTVAQITRTGLVNGVATGTSKIKAALDGVSTSASLIVYVGDFAERISSTYQAVVTGHSTSFVINIVPQSGFSADVTLSVGGLPSGAAASFSPSATVSGGGSATLTISANTKTTLGAYTLTLTAAAGTLSHSAEVGLGVNSSPGNFSVSISPNPISWFSGTDGEGGIISVTPSGGFTSDVTLSISGLPSGFVSNVFNNNVVIGGSGVAPLYLQVATSEPSGTYFFTLTGTSGALVNSTTVKVNLN